MTREEEKRAAIIAAQAAREALLPPMRFGKRRTNWAASAPKAPVKGPYFPASKSTSEAPPRPAGEPDGKK